MRVLEPQAGLPHRVRLSDTVPQPWRNGGGATRELLAWPSPSAWRVRLSVADIEADGPFSAYPGVERWFAVIEGQGVSLQWEATRVTLDARSAPLRFDGAPAPRATLTGGPTRDLNLMLQGARGRLVAAPAGGARTTDAHPGPAGTPAFTMGGLFSACPGMLSWKAGQLQIEAHELVWFDALPEGLRFEPDAHPRDGNGAGAPAGWWVLAQAGEDTP